VPVRTALRASDFGTPHHVPIYTLEEFITMATRDYSNSSTDTHIKFDGVEGESPHKDHKGEVQVLAWNWSLSNGSSSTVGGGSARGRATPGALKFSHQYDKASPVLAKKCVEGIHFPTVTLTARKAGEGQKDFLKVTMKEVFITAVKPSAESSGDIIEDVDMSYGDIEFAYKPQDDKGALGGDVKFGWNAKSTELR
jgi:type VI secretion system secreted protein Hcp